MNDVVVIEYEDDKNLKTIFGIIVTGKIIDIIKFNNLSESVRREISMYGWCNDETIKIMYVTRSINVDGFKKRVQMFERIKKLERIV